MGEYIHMFVGAAFFTTLFLGWMVVESNHRLGSSSNRRFLDDSLAIWHCAWQSFCTRLLGNDGQVDPPSVSF